MHAYLNEQECVCVCIYIYRSIDRSIYLPTYLSIFLPIYLSFFYLPTYLPTYRSIFLYIYICMYVSIYLSVCLSIYLYIYIYVLIGMWVCKSSDKQWTSEMQGSKHNTGWVPSAVPVQWHLPDPQVFFSRAHRQTIHQRASPPYVSLPLLDLW